MKTPYRSGPKVILAGIVMATGLTACTITAQVAPQPRPIYQPPPVVYYKPAPPPRPIFQPPPPLRPEFIPPPPPGTYVWLPGHWVWAGGNNYNWVRGKYVYRQPNYHQWVHGSWVLVNNNWSWVPGHWE